ncbi:MAG: hypothetical protein H0X03_09300 [Nitrosopumilus sp.]|nr:hypothetical protein [Nitrosopumilus sp.]
MSEQLTDETARQVEALWKEAFPGATLFPGIGLPSQDNGVLLLTHTLNLGKVMKINGLPSSSPLASNSLYSAENINGKTLNIYEVQIPDIPGENGNPSTGQIYVQELCKQGLVVAGNHQHWTGEYFYDDEVRDHNVPAIHHQQYDMDPIEFSRRTITALLVAVQEIKNRVGDVTPDDIDDTTCGIDDCVAYKILRIWKRSFPDSFILPVVGFPSNNNNKVAVFSHTAGHDMLMRVNGLESKSPLSNNALYSFECTRDKFLHFYEIMIPDIPGEDGERSTAQIYVNALARNGLDVSGVHWHFWGGVDKDEDRGVFAVHHQNIGMTPREFSCATIRALNEVFSVISERTHSDDNHRQHKRANDCDCEKKHVQKKRTNERSSNKKHSQKKRDCECNNCRCH